MSTETRPTPAKPCNSVADVVEKLTSSICIPDGVEHSAPVPDVARLVQIIQQLRGIVYPGFYFHQVPLDELNEVLEREVTAVQAGLAMEIAHAIARNTEACADMEKPLGPDDHQPSPEERPALANQLATKFMCRMPDIRRKLLTDVKAAYVGDPACRNLDEVILCYPGLTAITVYRLAHELHLLRVPFLPRMMTEWAHSETGVDIHPGATIADHFFIDHGTGVVIGETCEIGQHVKLYQGVTLGALSFPQDENGELVRHTKRHPTIEDNVIIYANATVLGGKTVVGRDSVIGSSVWLTSSVDPSTTVIMEKPRLRMRNQLLSDMEPPIDFQI